MRWRAGPRRGGRPSAEAAGTAVALPGLRRRLRLPISAILVGGFGGLMTIAMVTVIALGLTAAGRNTFDLLADKAALTLDAVTQRLSAHMAPVRDQADYLADQLRSGELSLARPTALADALRQALGSTPQITGISVQDADSRSVRVGRFPDGLVTLIGPLADVGTARAIWQEAKARPAPYWFDPIWEPSLERTIVSHNRAIRRDGEMVAVLLIGVSLADLSTFLDDLYLESGTNAFVLDSGRYVIAHRALTAPGTRVDVADRTPPLPRIDEVGDPVLEGLVAEARRDGERLDEEVGETGFRGISVVEIDDTGGPADGHLALMRATPAFGSRAWQVGAIVETEEIADELLRFAKAIGASVVVLLLAVAAALFIGIKVSRKLHRLADAAAAMATLDFAHTPELPDSRVREMAEAAAAFNAMKAGLGWFEAYVPKALVLRLMRLHGRQGVVAEERELTVLFTDIRGFTGLSARLPPAETAALLNRHFALVAARIEAEGGTVDKFIGDGVMAFWGAPDDQPDHAARAVRAARAIAADLAADNRRRATPGGGVLGVRLGLHSGPALVGNIGSRSRINYTIVGETVNIAARIEALGKVVAPQAETVVLASADTIRESGCAEHEPIGERRLRGVAGPLAIHRLAPAAPDQDAASRK